MIETFHMGRTAALITLRAVGVLQGLLGVALVVASVLALPLTDEFTFIHFSLICLLGVVVLMAAVFLLFRHRWAWLVSVIGAGTALTIVVLYVLLADPSIEAIVLLIVLGGHSLTLWLCRGALHKADDLVEWRRFYLQAAVVASGGAAAALVVGVLVGVLRYVFEWTGELPGLSLSRWIRSLMVVTAWSAVLTVGAVSLHKSRAWGWWLLLALHSLSLTLTVVVLIVGNPNTTVTAFMLLTSPIQVSVLLMLLVGRKALAESSVEPSGLRVDHGEPKINSSGLPHDS